VKEAGTVALENLPSTERNGYAVFSVGGRSYSLGRRFDPSQPVHLLVVVDPKKVSPIEAYDMATGKKVYGASEKISIYLDPRVENGRLVEPGEPYRTVDKVHGSFWRREEVRNASSVALSNVPGSFEEGVARFSVAAKNYATTLRMDQGTETRLLVTVDPKTQLPTAAFDLETGDQVYPLPDPIEVYLDPEVVAGKLAGGQELFRRLQRIGPSFWKIPGVESAGRIAISNFRTHRSGEAASFSLASGVYRTTRRFDDANPPRLLILADPKNRSPVIAYDMPTGEQVYPALTGAADPRLEALADLAESDENAPGPSAKGADPRLSALSDLAEEGTQAGAEENQIEIHLDPRIKDGKILGNPKPFRVAPRFQLDYWDWKEVGESKRVVLSGVRPYHHKGSSAVFAMTGKKYRLNIKFYEGLRLMVVLDPKGRVPVEAYDQSTGKKVYERGDMVRIYVDPQVEDGRLVGDPSPFQLVRFVNKAFWRLPEIAQAETVVFSNVTTHRMNEMTEFALSGQKYLIPQPFDEKQPLRLLVIVAPSTQAVSAAFDQATGKHVYPSDRPIRIYLNPVIENGRLAGDSAPFRSFANVGPSFWSLPEVSKASRVAFAGVQTFRSEKNAAFSFGRAHYTTNQKFNSEKRAQLLVIVDTAQRVPQEAYDLETGERVFSSENLIDIYFDPPMEGGRLAGKPVPVRRTQFLQASHWNLAKSQGAEKVVLGNVETYDWHGWAGFSVARQHYKTRHPYSAGEPARLLVVVDSKTRFPLLAYNQADGTQIFPSDSDATSRITKPAKPKSRLDTDLISFYRDPVIVKGFLASDSVPFAKGYVISSRLWSRPEVEKASSIGIAGIPARKLERKFGFALGGRDYTTNRPFEAQRPLKLLVVSDRNRQPLMVYDQETGEAVYSSDEVIRVYLDPEIHNGKITAAAVSFRDIRNVRLALWKDRVVSEAGRVVFEGVSGRYHQGHLKFFLLGKHYYTGYPMRSKAHVRLLVEVDSRTKRALAAYNASTGERIFSASSLIQIFLDPVIRDGFLEGNPKPFRSMGQVENSLFDNIAVKQAKLAVFTNVPVAKNRRFSMVGIQYPVSDQENPEVLRLMVLVDPNARPVVPIAAYDMATGQQLYSFSQQPADPRLGTLADLAEEGAQAGAEEGKPAQAGVEELVGRAVRGWGSDGGTAAVVLSSSLLNQPYAEKLRAALRNLPPDLAGRVYLAGNWKGLKEANRHLKVIPNGSADDVAVAVGQQVPSPEKVWLVGEFTPVYGWMLKQMGLEPEKISSGADIQEFLAQLGILLGVPEAQVQSGVEELHRAEETVEGQA